MTYLRRRRFLIPSLTVAMLATVLSPEVLSQASSTQSTSASPSACWLSFSLQRDLRLPACRRAPAPGQWQKTSGGQLIVGISEHVSLLERLGWKDPFSTDLYTSRQNDYGTHFGLER